MQKLLSAIISGIISSILIPIRNLEYYFKTHKWFILLSVIADLKSIWINFSRLKDYLHIIVMAGSIIDNLKSFQTLGNEAF